VWLSVLPLRSAVALPEPASCRIVRFSDIGWTDVTAITGLASHLVRRLGYEPQVTVLSVPVTFASLKNKDIDVFLGNWMPAMEADIRLYVADGSVEVVGANLTGAMIMRKREQLDRSDDALCLDDADCAEDERAVIVAPTSLSLQALIDLRRRTGHPVLLAEGEQVLGGCGETEIIGALAARGPGTAA
jgi:hypothetical protein